MLSTLILLPLITSSILLFIDSQRILIIRWVALVGALLTFWYSIYLFLFFDSSLSGFQLLEFFNWNSVIGLKFRLGVDGLALCLILLTAFIIPVCLLVSWSSVSLYTKEYMVAFLLLEAALCAVFSLLDIFLFYIAFEATLLPMFFIVGLWGSRTRRVKAAYFLFLYTLLGSVLMLLAILYLWISRGTTDFVILQTISLTELEQIVLWVGFFLSFAIKIPMVPFHIWLPEAHVEAPTAGSVILAGILLKLGGYGFLRFSIVLFPLATAFFTPFVILLSLLGVVYASLTTLQQVDLKKIIAYSSVAHMGFVTLGIFSLNIFGLEGSVFLMLSHGFVSSALFLCVGILYDRFHTRIVKNYSGIVQVMPIFSVFFLGFSLANLGLPLTSSFIGELLVLLGVFQMSPTSALLATTSVIFGAAYSLWLVNRVCFGNLKTLMIIPGLDLSRREFFILAPFSVLTIFLGVYPNLILSRIYVSLLSLL